MNRALPFYAIILSAILIACGRGGGDEPEQIETPEPAFEQPVVEVRLPVRYGTATESRVRVRSTAGLDGAQLGHLYERDLIAIFEVSDETEQIDDMVAPWLNIQTLTGLEGWVYGYFIADASEPEYRRAVTLRTVATINAPWEPGEATEGELRSGRWELTGSSVSVDFFPGANAAEFTTAGGEPLLVGTEDEVTMTGAWRIKNGYVVTELIDASDRATEFPIPAGFSIWNLVEQGGDVILQDFYRESVPPISRVSRVGEASE